MLEESKKSKAEATVGFVLRYAPFYKKIKDIVDSGELGEILTVSATESVNHNLVMVFNRGWRRDISIAGPFLLEKCCHDFDILNCIIGSKAVRVSSFGSKKHFSLENQPSAHCKKCDIVNECLYSYLHNSKRIGNSYVVTNEAGLMKEEEVDICVYNDVHNDHQVVNIEYENGATAAFTYSWWVPYPVRTMHIMGSKGELYGNIRKSAISVDVFSAKEVKNYEIKVEHDISGHHGADSVITNAMFDVMKGKTEASRAGIEEGVNAAIISLLADYSGRSGEIVDINKYIQKFYDKGET